MIRQLRPAFSIFGLLTFLAGVLYPLLVTGIAQLVFPFQANGSLIEINSVMHGSRLIGQNFTGSQYFWGRPSATPGSPYNAFDPVNLIGSSGSNLGPLSPSLFESVQNRVDLLKSSDPGNPLIIPIDLVTYSASGLDPHISLEAAYYQVPRVACERGLSEQDVIELVNRHKETRQFGFLGEPRVNVLLLNIALDGLQ
jgi:K+-transporting ATPase KdpC subunit